MDTADIQTKGNIKAHWQRLGQMTLLFLIVGWFFQASITPLFARWVMWDKDLAHAIPTLFAFLYLVWRAPMAYQPNRPPIRYALIITLGLTSVAWLLFVIANITILANITVWLMLPLIIASCYSLASMRGLLPLFGILFFTLPLLSELNSLLVYLSARAVGYLIHFFGMTALIEGQNIFIPSGHIFIADGCSGLRYFTISLLLGYLLCILNNYRAKGIIVCMLIAMALGLGANWLRIFFLVIIGHVTEMQSSLMHDHETFGWVLFACLMFPAIYFAPINRPSPTRVITTPTLKALAPLIALATGPVLLLLISSNLNLSSATSLNLQQIMQANTAYTRPPLNLLIPEGQTNHSGEIHIQGTTFFTQLQEYRPQNLKEKLIPYVPNVYDRDEWQLQKENGITSIEALGFQFLQLHNSRQDKHIILVYRFEVGRFNTQQYSTAKMLQIPAILTGHDYANFFSLQAVCKNSHCEEERLEAVQLANNWHNKTKALR
jgi:exosortase